MVGLPVRFTTFLPMVSPASTHLKVEVFFSPGGLNYTTYKTERKGIYVGFTPVTREVTPTATVERYTFLAGMKMLLAETPRMNRKATAAHAERVFALAEGVLAHWMARDFEGLRAVVAALPPTVN